MTSAGFNKAEHAAMLNVLAKRWAHLAAITSAQPDVAKCPYNYWGLGEAREAVMKRGRARLAAFNSERVALAGALFKLGIETLPEVPSAAFFREYKITAPHKRTYVCWVSRAADEWKERAAGEIIEASREQF